MISLKSKLFWIAFPLAVTAMSILGVSQLRHQAEPAALPTPVENATGPTGPGGAIPTSASPPLQITIPAHTEIEVRLNQSIATKRVVSGDPFFATVADPVVVRGQTVIPAGAPVKGRVVSTHEAGRLKGVAELRLAHD